MTVRELIAELIEYDMDADIVIRGNNGMDYEDFSNFDITTSYNISTRDDVVIDFQTDGKAIVENDEFEQMKEKIDEMEDEING